MFNGMRDRGITIKRSIYGYNTAAGAGTTVTQILQFDPSGANDSLTTGIFDWSNWVALYSKYKVRHIKASFILQEAAVAPLTTPMPEIFIRFNYDNRFVGNTLTTTQLDEVPGWKHFMFDQTARAVTYKLYPKVPMMGATLASQVPGGSAGPTSASYTSVMRKMPWINVTPPISGVSTTPALYGLMYYVPVLQIGISIRIDLEYVLSFKDTIG